MSLASVIVFQFIWPSSHVDEGMFCCLQKMVCWDGSPYTKSLNLYNSGNAADINAYLSVNMSLPSKHVAQSSVHILYHTHTQIIISSEKNKNPPNYRFPLYCGEEGFTRLVRRQQRRRWLSGTCSTASMVPVRLTDTLAARTVLGKYV